MDIYVEVLTKPVIQPLTTKAGTDIGTIAFYYAKYEGDEIIVQVTGSSIETLPSVGSKGLISGEFEEQRFYDDSGERLGMRYFFVGKNRGLV